MSSEVPEGWSVNSLGELADLIMGQSPPSSVVTEEGEGLPFIQGNAEFGARHPTPRLVASTTPKVVQKGDILISVRAPVGEVNIAESPLCIGRGVGGIRAKDCDPDFLFYAVGGLSQTFARLSQGSTFDAINGKELRSIEILVPPKDEQRQVAEVLRSVEDVIISNEKALGAARELVRHLAADIASRATEHAPIGSLWDVVTGRTPTPDNRELWDGDLPFVTPGDIDDQDISVRSSARSLNAFAPHGGRVVPAGTGIRPMASYSVWAR